MEGYRVKKIQGVLNKLVRKTFILKRKECTREGKGSHGCVHRVQLVDCQNRGRQVRRFKWIKRQGKGRYIEINQHGEERWERDIRDSWNRRINKWE